MARIMTLDIETIPTQSGLARLIEKKGGEIEAPGNYKDPVKIAAYIAEKQVALEATCRKEASLSPLYGQVAAISAWDVLAQAGDALHLRSPGIEGSERVLLAGIAEELADVDLLVTFNGHHFDGPFLTTRMLVHGITPPSSLFGRRYSVHPHLDLYAYLTNWQEYGRGGLADWCALFGVACPDKELGLTGADVARLVETRQWDLLHDYSLGGAISTWHLLSRVWPALRHQLPGLQHVQLPTAGGLTTTTGATLAALAGDQSAA